MIDAESHPDRRAERKSLAYSETQAINAAFLRSGPAISRRRAKYDVYSSRSGGNLHRNSAFTPQFGPSFPNEKESAMKILCLWHATDDELSVIKHALPSDTDVVAPKGEYFSRFEASYEDLAADAVDADAFIGWGIPAGILEIAERLKVYAHMGSGVDDLNLPLIKQRGVRLANSRGANAIALAEHAMMFILSLAKKTVPRHEVTSQQGRGSFFPLWEPDTRASMLNGRTLGVIGVGKIGSLIAKYAKGFDMHVLGVRRNKTRAVEHVDSMHSLDELHHVLPQCDYVVLTVPATRETVGLFGESALAAMKPSAFLINVARMDLVREKPLYDALTSGRLRGYAADIWWRYDMGQSQPVSFGSRLAVHQLPNVLCSDNDAHNADDVLETSIQFGTRILVEFAEGKPLTTEVDLHLGYGPDVQ
ncbi:NAD(P)-dependent oxidoreductase [Mesorhizobium sp. M1396]|uniref:NAD(P)-dependent oxidoreductase n=1 Tax=Mesorhizobium sp. M1396 TaxID=2957095 RepID=UPI003338B553